VPGVASFKLVSDRFGYGARDELLIQIPPRL
jgi:GGDEF domain-containing protein